MKHYEFTTARVSFLQHDSVSDLTLDRFRVKDFDAYYRDLHAGQLEAGSISRMPESLSWPVTEYKDRVLSIDSLDPHSVLLYVPQHEFK